MANYPLFNRELSWLSFNQRVLQECLDTTVPFFEKIKFMAIFSSNLDEFFRVRVASLRYLLNLKEKDAAKIKPARLLKQIHSSVTQQQVQLGEIYRDIILKGLIKRRIHLINNSQYTEQQRKFAHSYFKENVLPYCQPILLSKNTSSFLQNKQLYLAVSLITGRNADKKKKPRRKYALVEIPVNYTGRFIMLAPVKNKKFITFIDDIIKASLSLIFPGYIIENSYAIKLTRDAEMYIDDEFSGNLLEKIKKGISRRKTGVPSRFLYDENMPDLMLKYLKQVFLLSKEDLVSGGRYHNFSDFFTFPKIGNKKDYDQTMQALNVNLLEHEPDLFSFLNRQDILLFYPYQKYDYLINFLDRAAKDERVSEIKITLYRVAEPSAVIEKLILAARNGKRVTAFVELKARFDEEANIQGARELESSGVNVIYSIPGIKVHSKICLITRVSEIEPENYAYMATGNFNEKTATLYSDLGILTANSKYTTDLNRVFAFLEKREKKPDFEVLLVAPFNMRQRFEELINQEIENAKTGKDAYIIAKMNSLQDPKMIRKLYKASSAGVKIKLIVRGICCLIPGVKGVSENIEVISILDRFLEHSRIYLFCNAGKEKYFSGSADWMTRNLKRRVEVIFPIFEKKIQQQLKKILDLQWSDNTKARIIDEQQKNNYKPDSSKTKIRSQIATYNYLKKYS